MDLEQRVQKIEERNTTVETDKAWEIHPVRKSPEESHVTI